MKVTLSKEVTLHTAVTYMKIKKNVVRSDIQEYLNGKRFDNNLINKRIDAYLKEIEILDEYGQLTGLGERVRNTALLPTYEEGKYRIWYTENDDYFGRKILYFRRETPQEYQPKRDRTIDSEPLSFEENNFLIPVKERNSENNFTEFYLLNKDLYMVYDNNRNRVNINLVLEDEKRVLCYFSGLIGKDCSIKSQPVEREEKLNEIIYEILPDWNEENERLRIRFEEVADEKGRKSFEIQQYPCKWKDFSGHIDSVKLMPFDKENAVVWRNHLLISKIRDSYLSTEDFQNTAEDINEEAAFEDYRDRLEIPSQENILKKQSKDNLVYWHLNAPMDLNPNTMFNIEHAITLLKDESTSFSEIIQKIGVSLNNELVVFYDRYIIDDKQQKAVAAFMRSVNANKKIIITDMSQNKSSFIEKNCKDIRMRDFNQGIFSGPKAHDRYLIVVSNGKTKVWVITSSLMDKIIFPKNKDIDADISGKVKGNVTITPIDEKDLDKDLSNFVKGAKNGK